MASFLKPDKKKLLRSNGIQLLDMHTHLDLFSMNTRVKKVRKFREKEELSLREKNMIMSCFSAGTREEWNWLREVNQDAYILRSFGIHPWFADQYSVTEMYDAYQEADFIGEIGMDAVWCEVSQYVQEKQFESQLQIAADLHKPILLHTKGYEKRIAEMLADFPGKICVHWYSGTEKDLGLYLDKGCYFTLGPDTSDVKDAEDRKSRERIINEVPLHRLFTETDGISAVAWVRNTDTLDLMEIPLVLMETVKYIAKRKKITTEEVSKTIKNNLEDFLSF